MVARRNRLIQAKLGQKHPQLRLLPPAPVPEYANRRVVVRSAIQSVGACTPTLTAYWRTTCWDSWNRLGRAGRPGRLPPRHRLPPVVARGRLWCASPGPSPATASVSGGVTRPTSGSPTTPCGSAAGHGPLAEPAPAGDHHGIAGGQRPGAEGQAFSISGSPKVKGHIYQG